MEQLSWKVGDIRITRIPESVASVPFDGLLRGGRPEAIERNRDWLRPNFVDDDGLAVLSIHGLVVEDGDRRILVDTCIGQHAVPGLSLDTSNSPFLTNLAGAGFPPESIDIVLCTHLHFDHVGWNTTTRNGELVPTFPNARYLIGRVEWEHWRDAPDKGYATTIDATVRPIIEAGQADLVETDHRISDAVWLEATPGHSPGHVAVRLSSGGEQALITGDLTHHPIQWAEPDWAAAPDYDSDESTRTRRRLIAEHGDRGTLIIGTHYAPPTGGYLVSSPAGTRFDTSPR